MIARALSDPELNTHPALRERVGELLLAVVDEMGELKEADAAEMHIIDQMRQMGHESLMAWAQQQVVKTTAEARQAKAT